jgi:hypothetical protein
MSNRRRLMAAAATVAVAAGGATAAHAAGAPIDAISVLTSSTVVRSCQTTGVDVDYDVAYAPDLRGYAVTAAHLDGLDADCAGQRAQVTLSGPDGPLAHLEGTVSGDRLTLPVDAPVPASDLTGVSVTLSA